MKKKTIGIIVSVIVLLSAIWFVMNFIKSNHSYCYGKLQIPCIYNIGFLFILLIIASYVYQVRNSIAFKTKLKLMTKLGLIAIVLLLLSMIGNIYADRNAEASISMAPSDYVVFYFVTDTILSIFIIVGALVFFWNNKNE